jgi:2-dehydro-3-deoxygluconokinase
VDISQVSIHENASTGVMFKEIHEERETRVYYYRKGSAASLMTPCDLNEEYIAGAKILHITGITPALSESCMDTLLEAIDVAKKHGLKVSFDPNIRLKLWSREKAAEVIKSILPLADIVLPGVDEGNIIFNLDSPEETVDEFLKYGVKSKVALTY